MSAYNLRVMNIEMDQACTGRILEAVCKRANLELEMKYSETGRHRAMYSVNGSPFLFVKEAMVRAIQDCELNGEWIEDFGIKTRNGFPVFKRVA